MSPKTARCVHVSITIGRGELHAVKLLVTIEQGYAVDTTMIQLPATRYYQRLIGYTTGLQQNSGSTMSYYPQGCRYSNDTTMIQITTAIFRLCESGLDVQP